MSDDSPLDSYLPELATLGQIEKLVRLALDRGTSLDERRTAALKACERIGQSGMLEKLGKLRAWVSENKHMVQRATGLSAFLNSFRARP